MKSLMIPASLNVKQMLNGNSKPTPGFNIDKVHAVCHLLYFGSRKLDKETLMHPTKEEKYYIPLHSDVLSHYFGDRYYLAILKWMQRTGLIECDGKFQKEVASNGYRFTENYRNTEFVWVNVTDFTMYCKAHFEGKENVVKMSKTVKALTKWYKGLELDQAAASKMIDFVYEGDMEFAGYKDGKIRASLEERAEHRRFLLKFNLSLFDRKEFRHKQDNYGLRLHTLITGLPKELRPFVFYNGERLAQGDISNSQYFFLSTLFFEDEWIKTNNPTFWRNLKLPSSPSKLFSILSRKFPKSFDCIDFYAAALANPKSSYFDQSEMSIFGEY